MENYGLIVASGELYFNNKIEDMKVEPINKKQQLWKTL